MLRSVGSEKAKTGLHGGVADVCEVPPFDARIFFVEVLVPPRDVRQRDRHLKARVQRIVQLKRGQAVDGADLIVIGRYRADLRAPAADALLILVDVLERAIE